MRWIAPAVLALALALTVAPSQARSDAPTKAQRIAAAQERWADSLAHCESGGNPSAINPHDTDGTPSFGEFQFKPPTFYWLSARYGMSTTTDYMDAAQQRAIVLSMERDRRITDWAWSHIYFPDCVTNHVGLPQKNGL